MRCSIEPLQRGAEVVDRFDVAGARHCRLAGALPKRQRLLSQVRAAEVKRDDLRARQARWGYDSARIIGNFDAAAGHTEPQEPVVIFQPAQALVENTDARKCGTMEQQSGSR